jgi:glutamate/tyrosine decarboxylase-like PLP-dependent enzyme
VAWLCPACEQRVNRCGRAAATARRYSAAVEGVPAGSDVAQAEATGSTGASPHGGIDAAGRDDLLVDAAVRARRYVEQADLRRVGPLPEAVAGLSRFDFPFPDHGVDAGSVLALLDDAGSPATMGSTSPRYFGFVCGGVLPVALAASWLLAAWDQNAGLTALSPAAAYLDDVALRWVCDALGLPEGTGGGFTSGATMANAACLASARDRVLTDAGWDALRMGLVGAPPVQLFVGEEVHAAAIKAAGLVGLGRDRAVRLPVDEQGAILASELPEIAAPAIVCLQAGNVNSGASDPFGPLIEWAHSAGAWVHVDGAFGLWAAASPEVAAQAAGVEAADSWATDAHKWLNSTYDCGIALVREPQFLEAALRSEASYLPFSTAREPTLFTPQSSQRARGAEVWAVLAALGRDGLAELVSRPCRLARRFAAGLEAGGLEVLNEVVLNQVVVAFDDGADGPGFTDAVVAEVQRDGTCWCGPTTWHGRRAMRVSVSNWATQDKDVDRSVAAVLAATERLKAGSAVG